MSTDPLSGPALMIVNRIRRYRRLLELDAPAVIISNEEKLVRKAFDLATALELCEAFEKFSTWNAHMSETEAQQRLGTDGEN